jgi:dihydroxyacetone kinase-like predicted kinase
MNDLELAQIKLDCAQHNEREASRRAQLAEAAWREAVETRAVSSSLASHRYFKAEQALEQAREALAQARAALRSASIADAVA